MIHAIVWGLVVGVIEYVVMSRIVRRDLRRQRASEDPLVRAYAVPVAAASQTVMVLASITIAVLFGLLKYLEAPTWLALTVLIGTSLAFAVWETRRIREITE